MKVALAIVSLALMSLGARVARADTARFSLDIDSQCDCAATTRSAFDTLFGRSFDDVLRERDATLAITISHEDEGRWSGSTLLAMDGRTAERRIDAGSCREITEALTLLVAIAIEPSLRFVPATDSEVARPQAPTPSPPPRRVAEPQTPAPLPTRLSTYAAASLEFATLPAPSPIFSVGATARFPSRLALSLDVGTGVPVVASSPVLANEAVELHALVTASFRACYYVAVAERFELATCGGYRHLVARAEGSGFDRSLAATLHTPSILAGASLTWKPLAHLSLRVGIDSLFHLVTHSLDARETFFGERVTLHTTASAGLSPTVAVEIVP